MKYIKWILVCATLSFSTLISPSVARSAETAYPNSDEIHLLMNQADRAMKLYEQLVGQETGLLGANADTATDLKLLSAWKAVKGALDKDPQKFNSFAGFDIATIIDDASRNVALISNLAATEALKQITGGKITDKTDSLVTLMQSANDTGTLLYTISENAAELYRKFLRWQGDTLQESVSELGKCAGTKK